MKTMNKEMKKALLEAHRADRERRLTEIHARIEARKAEHEQKLEAVHARIEARREEARREKENLRKAEPVARVAPDPEVRAMKDAMMANVPVLQFPADDPKYNSAEKHDLG